MAAKATSSMFVRSTSRPGPSGPYARPQTILPQPRARLVIASRSSGVSLRAAMSWASLRLRQSTRPVFLPSSYPTQLALQSRSCTRKSESRRGELPTYQTPPNCFRINPDRCTERIGVKSRVAVRIDSLVKVDGPSTIEVWPSLLDGHDRPVEMPAESQVSTIARGEVGWLNCGAQISLSVDPRVG